MRFPSKSNVLMVEVDGMAPEKTILMSYLREGCSTSMFPRHSMPYMPIRPGVVAGASMGRQSYGSPMECMGLLEGI